MKKLIYSLALFFIVSMVQGQELKKLKKVVFIIVDGISFDQLQTAHSPNLDQIGAQGAFSQAFVGGIANSYAETPTISAVGYNSLLTGTWANKHNVYGNGIKNPNYNYPTIFELFKNSNPNGTTAVFSSWLDNRTKLVGEGLKATGSYQVDYKYDGLEHDTINYPHDKERNFMKMIDLNVALKASEIIENEGPDLSWVYLEFTDDMGHAFGDSPRFKAAVTFEDELIGRIYKAVKAREELYNEEWLFVVTTDHGRSSVDGRGHGGQSDRERSTWIVTNLKQVNSYFKLETPAIVDILPTMTDFLSIKLPQNLKRELDGVSFLKPVEATQLRATIKKNKMKLTWKNLSNKTLKGNVYVSTTNNFNTGGEDKYTFIGAVNLAKETFEASLKKLKSGFYKVVLETPNTTLNYWLTKQ